MSRQPRAGTAAHSRVTIRLTREEHALWRAAIQLAGASSLSDVARAAMTAWAIRIVAHQMPAGARKSRLLGRIA